MKKLLLAFCLVATPVFAGEQITLDDQTKNDLIQIQQTINNLQMQQQTIINMYVRLKGDKTKNYRIDPNFSMLIENEPPKIEAEK